MPELIAAIDVGTTGARTIIFDSTGQMRGVEYQEYPIITPKPGWVEQDAGQWWDVVCENTRNVLRSKKVNPTDISAIVITNQRETIVPVDKSGLPLDNAIVWQDRRTIDQCKEIEDKVGKKKIYSITGLTIDPYFSAPKILWLKEKKSNIYSKTHKFLLVHDFIAKKLTDQFVTDLSNASRTMLFDINKFNWSEQLCETMDISIDKLPDCVPSGSIIGKLTNEASKATGLPAGTPVLAGGGDQQCAALGLGVINKGIVKATTGTGTFVIAHMDEPHLDLKARVLCSASVLPNSWVVESSIFTTGAVYRWFRDNLADMEQLEAKKRNIDVYELLNKKLASSEPGANGLIALTHFSGAGAPYWDPSAKGILYGLTLRHTKADILRALIEGVCCEIRKSIEVFSELGLDVTELRIAGGATRSKTWNQIQADVTNTTVVKTGYEETTALGAAIIGFVGVGYYKSYSDAVERIVALDEKYTPQKKNRKLYDNIYQKNLKLYREFL
jgi:xylulokinase/glycerol kinase